ncbi:MAG: OsmC family protein [Gemmatimonadetes bacterium]|nr:OsmC family protein [Gemmatimonadota bacterium]
MSEESFAVELVQRDGFEFGVDFDGDGLLDLRVDEPPPLGGGRGPNAARLLAAAVGHCLSASLLFCLRKARVEVGGIRTRVQGSLVRNEHGRLRVGELRIALQPELEPADRDRIGRCLEVFEDFCLVGQSVKRGIPLHIEVEPLVAAHASEEKNP